MKGVFVLHISKEGPEVTRKRLLRAISIAGFKMFPGAIVFEEFRLSLLGKIKDKALALVRDEETWSQLGPSTDKGKELVRIVSFYFDGHRDNCGFVGWLASLLKRILGTGVFGICGQKRNRGGIFDYWGCPFSVEDSFISEIQSLIEKGKPMRE